MDHYLPQSDGWFPTFVLLVGVTAITNSISCYNTDSYVRRLYARNQSDPATTTKTIHTTTIVVEEASPTAERRPSVTSLATAAVNESPTTALSSRTFATWNIVVGILRLYAAYHIHESSWYQMQMIANIVGLVHFTMEAFVFKTARPSGPWLAPVGVASIGLCWGVAQYSYYVR